MAPEQRSGLPQYLRTKRTQSGRTSWYIGGRFAQIKQRYPGTTDHNLCPFLLLHGLSNLADSR
jgi:hypothetical protein